MLGPLSRAKETTHLCTASDRDRRRPGGRGCRRSRRGTRNHRQIEVYRQDENWLLYVSYPKQQQTLCLEYVLPDLPSILPFCLRERVGPFLEFGLPVNGWNNVVL